LHRWGATVAMKGSDLFQHGKQLWLRLHEKAAVIVTTNLPFSEWTTVIPNAKLCKALIVDRITDRANIIETGTESYRFRRTLEKRKGKAAETKT
jgi:DNA replication protein DnaC